MTQELYPIVEQKKGKIAVCGFATRDFVHGNSMRHLAVQVIPVSLSQNTAGCLILLHRRSAHKRSSPNRLDFCGGHVAYDEEVFPRFYWDSQEVLRKSAHLTALREAQEEVRCNPPCVFRKEHLLQFGETCGFEADEPRADGSRNREYSTAYILGLPPGREVTVWDTDRTGEHELATVRLRLEDLLDAFSKTPDEFADGASRILSVISEDATLRERMRRLLMDAARSAADSGGGGGDG